MAPSRKIAMSGFGKDAGIFVDFLLSIVAILILSLSVARRGLDTAGQQLQSTSELLQSTNITRDFILLSLKCGPDNIETDSMASNTACVDDSKARFRASGQDGQSIVLRADLRSGVVVLSAASDRDAGFFAYGEEVLPRVSRRAVETVKKRLDALIPCFSIADPDRMPTVACDEKILNNAAKYMKARLSSEVPIAPSQLGVLELVLIEGHSDGVALSNNALNLPDNRAKSLLLGLLGKTWRSEQDNRLLDAFETDEEISIAPLLSHIALGQRLQQLCADEQQNTVCVALFADGTGLTRRAPARLFALSSFGRYSLRFGKTLSEEIPGYDQGQTTELNDACSGGPESHSELRAACDPRDRRAEIRILMSTVPEALLRLQAQPGNEACGYVDLFSASAVQALNHCEGEICFDTIREIARKGNVIGSRICAGLE